MPTADAESATSTATHGEDAAAELLASTRSVSAGSGVQELLFFVLVDEQIEYRATAQLPEADGASDEVVRVVEFVLSTRAALPARGAVLSTPL